MLKQQNEKYQIEFFSLIFIDKNNIKKKITHYIMHIFAKQNEQTRKNISWHEWWNR